MHTIFLFQYSNIHLYPMIFPNDRGPLRLGDVISHDRREKSKVPVEGLLRPDNFADPDEEASQSMERTRFLFGAKDIRKGSE